VVLQWSPPAESRIGLASLRQVDNYGYRQHV